MTTYLILMLAAACIAGAMLSATMLWLAWQMLQCYVRQRWRKIVRLPPLVAYYSQPSVTRGEPAEICVHSVRPARAKLLQLGRECVELNWKAELPPSLQSRRYHFWRGFAWKPNLTIDTSGLASGLYMLHLEHRDEPGTSFRMPLVVKPAEPVDVAVICSTNTWQAYNAFGGLSNYYDRGTPVPLRWLKQLMSLTNLRFTIGARRYIPAVPLPFARPNGAIDEDLRDLNACPIRSFSHLARAEWALLRFLEREPVDYGLFSDHDLAHDVLPTKAKLLVFSVHSEYWSEDMKGRLAAYVANGGNAAFFSGNNMFRTVEFTDVGLVVHDWRERRSPVAKLLGASYTAWGYKTYAGYRVADSRHWVFDGLELQDGDSFGERIVGSTATADEPWGASGYETDKVSADSGNLDFLAIGKNKAGPAHMVMRRVPGGGWVFNSGSVASAPWLNEDPVFAGIMRNLLKDALQPPIMSSHVDDSWDVLRETLMEVSAMS